MAAITPVTFTGSYSVLRNATAQANTGQTDWINRPAWAKYLLLYYNLTAVAGTTPEMTPSLLQADPVLRDDASATTLATFTLMSAAADGYIQIGPGVTGIADDVTTAATGDGVASVNLVLPALIGVKLLLDRTTGDETYTYTLAAEFRA